MLRRGRGLTLVGCGVALLLWPSSLAAQAAAPIDFSIANDDLPPPPPAPTTEPAPAPTPEPAASVPVPPPTSLPEAEPARDWYGWQLLINDFVALGALGGAAAAGVKGKTAIAVIVPVAIVYDLGGPTIHWLHQRKAIAGASLGVRIGVPFVGVMAGAAIAGCGSDESSSATSCRSRGAGYGALFGFAAATAIDAAFLAWDAPRAASNKAAAIRWAPFATPVEGGGALGVVGSF